MNAELYVDCRLADSSQGLPLLVPLPREAEMVEVRHGQKTYARLQVRQGVYNLKPHLAAIVIYLSDCESGENVVPMFPCSSQGAVESLRLALGGTVAKAGALTDCPFQGDSSAYNSGEFSK